MLNFGSSVKEDVLRSRPNFEDFVIARRKHYSQPEAQAFSFHKR